MARYLVHFVLVILGWHASTSGQPLPVYVLAGQSNMQGHAHIRTLSHLGTDKRTAAMLEEILDKSGQPMTVNDVWDFIRWPRRWGIGTSWPTDGRLWSRRRRSQDWTGIHVWHLHAKACSAADLDHQNCLGRQITAYRLPPAKRWSL